MDDFENENDELEEQQEEEEQQARDDDTSLYDKYKDIKDKKQKLEDFSNKLKNSKQNNSVAKGTGKTATKEKGKSAGKEAAKTTSKEAAKETGKEAGKTAGKEAGKAAGKEAGKEAAKVAAKEAAKTGAKVAAEGAASATGVGVVVAAGIEAADRINKLKKRANAKLKESTGIDLEGTKKKVILFIIIAIVGFLIFGIGTKYVASEELSGGLADLISRREARYDKKLVSFTNEQYEDLISKNFPNLPANYSGNDAGDPMYKDPCYKRMLKYVYNQNYNDLFTNTGDNIKSSDDAVNISADVAKKMVQAEKENFNKIKWKSTQTSYEYPKSSDPNTDVKPVSKSSSTVEINANSRISDSELKVPNISTYNISLNSSLAEKEKIYVSLVSSYLQKWIVPYAIMVDCNSRDFAINEVLEKMYNPLVLNLYQIKRDTKKTVNTYYLKCNVTKTTSVAKTLLTDTRCA